MFDKFQTKVGSIHATWSLQDSLCNCICTFFTLCIFNLMFSLKSGCVKIEERVRIFMSTSQLGESDEGKEHDWCVFM